MGCKSIAANTGHKFANVSLFSALRPLVDDVTELNFALG